MAMPPISVKEAIENWLDVQWEKNKKTVCVLSDHARTRMQRCFGCCVCVVR